MAGKAIALGGAWLGYSIFYFGLTQVQSGNYGFLDLVLPTRASRLADIPRDGGAGASLSNANAGSSSSPSAILHDGATVLGTVSKVLHFGVTKLHLPLP